MAGGAVDGARLHARELNYTSASHQCLNWRIMGKLQYVNRRAAKLPFEMHFVRSNFEGCMSGR